MQQWQIEMLAYLCKRGEPPGIDDVELTGRIWIVFGLEQIGRRGNVNDLRGTAAADFFEQVHLFEQIQLIGRKNSMLHILSLQSPRKRRA